MTFGWEKGGKVGKSWDAKTRFRLDLEAGFPSKRVVFLFFYFFPNFFIRMSCRVGWPISCNS